MQEAWSQEYSCQTSVDMPLIMFMLVTNYAYGVKTHSAPDASCKALTSITFLLIGRFLALES